MENPATPLQTLNKNTTKIYESKLRQELIVAISKSIQLNDDLIEINSLLEQVKSKTPGNFAAIAVLTNLLDKFYKKQNRAQDQIDEIKKKMAHST